jgi:uncharacterized protein YlzI (FlbEa/FlbD family)
MIKLMNLSNGHQGNPIYINPDHIIAVYPFAPDGGSIQTIVYGTPDTTWIVEEGIETVVKLIKEYKNIK